MTSVLDAAVGELNLELPDGKRLVNAPQASLYGGDAGLDSLELMRFLILVEQKVSQALGIAVSLADERALTRTESPYTNLKSLAGYLVELIEEARGS